MSARSRSNSASRSDDDSSIGDPVPTTDTPRANADENAAALPTDHSIGFDERLDRLQGLLDQLERGDLPLEDAMTLYERGVAELKVAHQTLAAAEERLEVLRSARRTSRLEPSEGGGREPRADGQDGSTRSDAPDLDQSDADLES